jgi:dihydroneopterin aldolase
MRTSITISGLQLYAFHGLFREEQQLGQKFTFDVHAEVDADGSHRDDDLSQSVRYDMLSPPIPHTLAQVAVRVELSRGQLAAG